MRSLQAGGSRRVCLWSWAPRSVICPIRERPAIDWESSTGLASLPLYLIETRANAGSLPLTAVPAMATFTGAGNRLGGQGAAGWGHGDVSFGAAGGF